MALERIDPLQQNDQLSLDHYARYLFVAPFCKGKRVLDAACGTGFGTHMLATFGASAILGVDNATEAISYANAHYNHPNANYLKRGIEDLSNTELGTFDLIVSFETLEHLPNTRAAIDIFAALLAPKGTLIVSVPNEGEQKVDNQFHLVQFTLSSLLSLLNAQFNQVVPYLQIFTLSSTITPHGTFTEGVAGTEIKQFPSSAYVFGDQVNNQRNASAFLAICTQDEILGFEPIHLESGDLWYYFFSEYQHVWQDIKKLGTSWEAQKQYIENLERKVELQEIYINQIEQQSGDIWLQLSQVGESWEKQKAHIIELETTSAANRQELEQVGESWEKQHNYIQQLEDQRNSLWSDIQELGQSWEKQRDYIHQIEHQRDSFWEQLQLVGSSWEKQHAYIVQIEQQCTEYLTKLQQIEQSRNSKNAE